MPDLELIGPERLHEIEPSVFGIKALYSPATGIVDFGQVADAFARNLLSSGGEILTGHEVIALKQHSSSSQLITPSRVVQARHVISCAGLYADRLAFAREGYHRMTINAGELWETLRYRGFRRLASRFWRVGLEELYRDFNKAAFLKALQRYLPDLRPADLLPGPSGVRAPALAPEGTLLDDFLVDGQGGMLHVRNAPSLAATSSLAIAEMIVHATEKQFELA